MKKQTGFTLIELAIVLVIIGLLLGGVLKGQELINSAKVKNMANDFKNVQIMLYGYQDKFHSLPGDDANVAAHVTGGTLATTPGTAGNAQIEGTWDSTTVTDESYLFWEHVRLSGLAPGSAAHTSAAEKAAYIPRNADGGRLGVQSVTTFKSTTGISDASLSGVFVVCSDSIIGKLAKQIDVALDDGETDKGAVRAIETGTMPGPSLAPASVDDSKFYTVCMTF